ncbi:hypothetical protein KKE58_03545 [Patescibacteria group bacterium]|nr:hypothetical protein [Patescibacteria group bacterium]
MENYNLKFKNDEKTQYYCYEISGTNQGCTFSVVPLRFTPPQGTTFYQEVKK